MSEQKPIKVILNGEMGAKFGREHELFCDSPNEALKIINASNPSFMQWIRDNKEKYSAYKVFAAMKDGTTVLLDNDTYLAAHNCESVTFTPMPAGAGGNGVGQAIVGVVLIIVGAALVYFGGPAAAKAGEYLIAAGISMLVGGVVSMLIGAPKLEQAGDSERKDKTSYYFDGPVNTTSQGVPVPLTYGRVKVGSHAISAAISIEQLL